MLHRPDTGYLALAAATGADGGRPPSYKSGVSPGGRRGSRIGGAIVRVCAAVAGFRQVIDDLGASRTVAVATSAARDAENGPELLAALAESYGVEARTISGEEEARLTFRGATGARAPRGGSAASTLVIDIGGGSTELVVGNPGEEPSFHVSTRAGSVRQTERHLRADPPSPDEVSALSLEVQGIVEAVPAELRRSTVQGIAVAGTATSLAAVDQELEPYDPSRVDGYTLELGACERMLAMLAVKDLEDHRLIPAAGKVNAPTGATE